ncbi:hypothetical protein E4P35_11020 [Thiopseudomonas sp. 4R-3cl]|nr:hypothetical protein E4P35_11020 [Thiopseudomonas sp. 4R-3cl]
MLYKFPIRIEKRDEVTEQWVEYMPLVHAGINKNVRRTGYEVLSGGAIQIKRSLIFEVRYSPPVREIAHNTQLYRIIYDGEAYDVIDYDDFEERHQTVKLVGAYY